MNRKQTSTYCFTYEIVTPDSAECGDTFENGFWDFGGWTYPIGGYDVSDDVASQNLADARTGAFDQPMTRGWLKRVRDTLGCSEVQVCGRTVTAYEIDPDVDFESGAETKRAVHIECTSEASARRVARALKR